jgi:HD-GYP domain-containing protein (c-di-GMP phosphodiesterase class II)
MTSHRPYRAGLGLDAALAEIEAGKNRLYDPAAVDARTALFRQKGFRFN